MSMNKQSGNGYNHKLPNIETLKNLYFTQELNSYQICKRYGVTPHAVSLKLKRYGYELRDGMEVWSLLGNNVELSTEAIDFLDGLLLGDGCIVLAGTKKSGRYSHTDKHKEYILWLMNKLQTFGIDSKYQRSQRGYHRLQSKHYRNFIQIRERWYPNGIKKIPIDLDLKPEILKNWYIGDGSYHKGKNGTKNGESVYICNEFDSEGRERMSNQLVKLDIESTIYPNSIYIKARSRKRFFEYMLSDNSEIPPSYEYKFIKEVKE